MQSILRCSAGVKFAPEPAGDQTTGGRATGVPPDAAGAASTPASAHESARRTPRVAKARTL
jgi:hypothetical protein